MAGERASCYTERDSEAAKAKLRRFHLISGFGRGIEAEDRAWAEEEEGEEDQYEDDFPAPRPVVEEEQPEPDPPGVTEESESSETGGDPEGNIVDYI